MLCFNDDINDTTDKISDGEYILAISRYNLNQSNIFNTNYFMLNNVDNYDNKSYQFLVYTQKNMNVILNTTSNGTISIPSYKSIPMSITAGDFQQQIYATLEDTNGAAFIFNCGPHYVDNFTTFGWKFNNQIVSGLYELKLYWDTPSTLTTIGKNNNQYRLITNGTILANVTIYDEENPKFIPIMSVKDVDDTNNPFELNKGDNKNFAFISSITPNSRVNIYYEQCANSTYDCIVYYPNDVGVPYTFYWYKNDQNESINLPDNSSLKEDLSINDNSLITFMIMEIELCNKDQVIISRQSVMINGSTSSTENKLTAGAIIGMICASVLVIALGAWWCLMRNSSGDGYRTLDE